MTNTFNQDEDLFIGALWLKFSEDPTVRDTRRLWKEVFDEFKKKLGKHS